MNLSLSQTSSSLSHLLLLMIFVIPSCVLSVDERHRNCINPSQCGALNNLSYPFWTKGKEDCGHPDFEVDCVGNVPEINISSVKFRIIDVDVFGSHTVRLARTDYVNNLCPRLSGGAKIGIGLACGLMGGVFIAGVVFCIIRRRRNNLLAQYTSKDLSNDLRKNLQALIPLKQYSYAELKRMTKSFTHVIGNGGFGTVYEGNLPDGHKVAVKVLKSSKGNGEEFINEVASMSKTSHVNIVSLLGFCYEGSKRAIIYEFLENGSLDKLITAGKDSTNATNWRTLYEILLGVARGLEYLHYGCKTRIVHFDIKPQNVLLDANLHPKVSDFGLAKLCEKKESVMSLVETRGTVGYIAPEVFSRMYGSVSHKSDVYSYGMLVLEMIGARKKGAANTVSNTSSMYFPDWIYKDIEKGECTRFLEDEITDEEEEEIVKKMIMVALWCIQSCPLHRPPMTKVVEMMEGSVDAFDIPPKPHLHLPTTHISESHWSSEETLILPV